jgi:hypothetical protein
MILPEVAQYAPRLSWSIGVMKSRLSVDFQLIPFLFPSSTSRQCFLTQRDFVSPLFVPIGAQMSKIIGFLPVIMNFSRRFLSLKTDGVKKR